MASDSPAPPERSFSLPLPLPLQFIEAWIAMWLGRHQDRILDYLKGENRTRRAALGKRRVPLCACLGLAFVQGCLVGNDPLPPSVRDAGGQQEPWQGDVRSTEPSPDRAVDKPTDMPTDMTDGRPYASTSCTDLRSKWYTALGAVSAGCLTDSDCIVVGTYAVCECGPSLSCDGAYVNASSYSGSSAEAIAKEFFGRPCKEPRACDCAPRTTSVCNAGQCSDPKPGGSCFGPPPDPPPEPPPPVEGYDAGWG